MLQISYDAVLGIVRFSGKGFYSLDDERNAARSARDAISRCRAINDDVRILVHGDSQVQKPEVLDAALQRYNELGRPHDRIAFVFESSLAKLQAARYFNVANRQCFISENAAIAWLRADSGAARIPS